MIKKNAIIVLSILTFLGLQFANAEWQVFDCSQLPREADTLWEESQATNLDNESEILSVIDDPDIEGNKLIEVDAKLEGSHSEMWFRGWDCDPSVGATLVYRAKGVEGGTRMMDMYIGNGTYRERLIARLNSSFKFDKSDEDTEADIVDATEWHIYRVTIDALNRFKLYIDEDPEMVLLSMGPQESDMNGFKFGDGGSDTYNTQYDWFAWDVSGSYAPGEGESLPNSLTDVKESHAVKPGNYKLAQNYPNPFNPTTNISFTLKKQGRTSLKVYNTNGELVETLVDQKMRAGEHNLVFSAQDLPSGVYFYKLQSGNFAKVRKMLLVK